MWRITAKGVVAHRARYALTGLAVMLGVAFVTGTLVLTATITRTFDNLYTQIYHGTAVVVRSRQAFNPGVNFTNQRQPIPASLQATVANVPGVAGTALDVEGYAQMVGRDGKPIGHPVNGPPTIGMAWIDVAALNPLRIASGRPPTAPGDVVIDKHTADSQHFRVGDRVTVLSQEAPTQLTVTGIVRWGTTDSPLGATIAAFAPVTASRLLGQPGTVNDINVEAVPGVSQAALAQRVQAAIGNPSIEAVTGREVTSEGQSTIHQAFGAFRTLLLVFAGIALFVGAFLIFNTFSIVVTQRIRELALLRAVGADSRQVLSAVAGESLVVGVLASAAGVVAGVGLAVLLRAGMGLLGFVVPATGMVLAPSTVAVAMGAGTLVTVASAVGPARRAARIAPLAAMQASASGDQRSLAKQTRRGLRLTAIGLIAMIIGVASIVAHPTVFVGLGSVALVVGVIMLGPVIAGPATRLLGIPAVRLGTSGAIGRGNASRNPRQTASTASALTIGVALVALMTVLATSAKASAGAVVDRVVKADFIVSANTTPGSPYGLSPAAATAVDRLPQVAATTTVRTGIVQVYGGTVPIDAVDTAHADQLFDIGVTEGRVPAMTGGGIAVSTSAASAHHLHLGSPVVVTFPTTGPKTFYVQVVYSQRQIAGDYVLTQAAAEANFPQQVVSQVFVKLAPGTSVGAGRQAISTALAAYPTAKVLDQTQYKAESTAQIDQDLNLVYGLLALAVIIALVGIANTLALAVYERTHELGLLRAVGMTRGQLRASVGAEAFIISLFGATEGLILGVLVGAALVSSERAQGVTRIAVPVAQLVVIVVTAALAGILAAWAPSRRAARLDILRAVTAD
jgi:putative ABC transport system permease protein